MISKMNFCGQDEKIKKYLMPEKLLYKAGDVSGEENIFIKRDIQISTTEPDCLVMRNSDGGENASVLLDFGFEFSGGVKILTEVFGCDSGIPEFRLVFGESAREAMSDIGEKNSTNDHSVRDFTVRLPMFSDMEFAQTGYRFIRIELLSKNATVKIKSVLGVFTYRDIPYLGGFRCSDGELNDIYGVAAYTCHLNMQGMIWDGIKRDRLVWIGDMHPEMLPGGAKGFSTFMSYYMLSALADAGKTAEALSILKTYYGGMLKAGATTFWEDFDINWLKDGAALDSLSGEYDIHGDNGAHCYIGYRHSLCHGWSSAPAAFLAERVLGIRILEPGCRRIGIYPELGGLEWAEGEYPTPYGTVSVKCRKTGDGKISVEYKAPEQIEIETGSGVSM